MVTGQPCVFMLDAENGRTELDRADVDDFTMPASSAHLHSVLAHASRRVRAAAWIQRNFTRLRVAYSTHFHVRPVRSSTFRRQAGTLQ